MIIGLPRISRRAAAFTLIELLVVVAILALLISILLPSLSRARAQAKATLCLSNLKQIGNAMAFYGSDYRDYLPPYCISRRINNSYSDHTNTPYWFQYLPFKYLYNNVAVATCPSDDLVDIRKKPQLRGPHLELKALRPIIFYSYAMNPNQPKSGQPVYPNTASGKIAVAPEVIPYGSSGVIERFNPGLASRLKRPSDFVFLLETASTGLLNPTSDFDLFRTDHGGGKDRMNLIFADTHAEPKNIRDIYPGDFSVRPPKPPPADADRWPGKFRALWFGDAAALTAKVY
jgi:prepilin-type N-terminal cleavage/methylation domain-containing protein